MELGRLNSMDEVVIEAAKEMAAKKESVILHQLSDLIEDGLIIVEETEPVLVSRHDLGRHTVEICQSVRLKPREKEVIEGLKQRVKYLENTLEASRSSANELLQAIGRSHG